MIIGITDTIRPSIAGTVRCGSKDETRGFPKNSPYFLLHDAEELIPALGEKPTEIYFTVLFNDMDSFLTQDLRYYTKNDLVCRSRHETGSAVASYYGSSSNKFDSNVAGLTTATFPNVLNALVRNCAVRSCPDFIAKRCKVNTNLSFVVPHHSMTRIFNLPNTSNSALYSIASAFEERKRKAYALMASKQYLAQAGQQEEADKIKITTLFAGEIFRLVKVKEDTKYFDQNGAKKTAKDQDVVYCEHVPFAKYLELFADKISSDDMSILMALQTGINMHNSRSLQFNQQGGLMIEAPSSEEQVLLGGAPQALLPEVSGVQSEPQGVGEISTQAPAAVAAKAVSLEDIAESERLAPLFSEISALLGLENTAGNRVATVRIHKSLEKTEKYLNDKIKELKKKQAAAPKAETKPQQEAKTVKATVVAQSSGDDNPLY